MRYLVLPALAILIAASCQDKPKPRTENAGLMISLGTNDVDSQAKAEDSIGAAFHALVLRRDDSLMKYLQYLQCYQDDLIIQNEIEIKYLRTEDEKLRPLFNKLDKARVKYAKLAALYKLNK